jgi:hypothetical protein
MTQIKSRDLLAKTGVGVDVKGDWIARGSAAQHRRG